MSSAQKVQRPFPAFFVSLLLINVIFAIDMLVDWGLFSGFLYLGVLPICAMSKNKKEVYIFAWLASIYMIFEVVVLSHRYDIMTNMINHAIAFSLLWIFAGILQNKS